MRQPDSSHFANDEEFVLTRTRELFQEQQQSIVCHADRLFAWLMPCQWVLSIGLAILISPLTWSGTQSEIHPHVWVAVLLGGIITSVPALFAILQPGKSLTRHTIAVGQMLMSAVLIHLTGGRIETHFHVFGSLAILAFYRDWKVLISASAIVYVDHLLRGLFWPQSVYGVLFAPVWRSLEHAGWVVFEVTFLIVAIRKSSREMQAVAERQANLECLKRSIERKVIERTAELTRENAERRQVEAQLAQAHQIAKLGSWEWLIAENKVFWSDETRRLYGLDPGTAGMPMSSCLDRVHPEDRARVNAVLDEALKSAKPFTCVHRALLPDGTERILQGRGELEIDADGKPIRMFGIVQDITEAKKAEEALIRSEEQLRQSQKMEAVGRLAGGVAHDFNNLLTVIHGYCAMAMEKARELPRLQKDLNEVQKAAERASSLTTQLLAFSRKQVLQPRVFQMNDVVAGMERMLRRLIGEDIQLCTIFEPNLPRVTADPGQIEQVILNLAVNARDAMPRGGKLTIQTASVTIDERMKFRDRHLAPGTYVMLAVSDNGVGMTAEVQQHLFEPFFTTKGVGKGTGLGLATCYGIICQSGGDICVYSEPNSGSTFKIYLPASQAAAESKPAGDSEIPDGDESVLLVEDDPAVRTLAATVLRERGYHVEESGDPMAALELFKDRSQFHLVVSDVIMPRMSGKELCQQIQQRWPQTRILLMSGYTDDALVHHGVLDEGLSFLEKPFSPARFARKVREVLDQAGD